MNIFLSSLLRKKFLVSLFAAVVLLALIIWQSGLISPGRVSPGRSDPLSQSFSGVPVTVQQVNLPLTYRAVGTVTSRTMVDVASRLVARISEIPFHSGDTVTKDQIIVELDNAELLAAENKTRQILQGALAAVQAANEKARQVRASFELTEKEAARTRTLAASGTLSQQALDNAEAHYREAGAVLAQAEQAYSIAVAESKSIEQSVLQSKTVLGYTTITSPMDGIVAERLADPGDLASPGKILLRLFDPARLMLEVPVRESLVTQITIGQQVHFNVEALHKTFSGDIREIVPAVDPASRTFMVKICIKQVSGLIPGMFGTLELPLGTRSALLIPYNAIIRVGQLEFVQAKLRNRISRVLVRTVPAVSNQCEVISGLSPGMTIYSK